MCTVKRRLQETSSSQCTVHMFRNKWLPINNHLLHLVGLAFICSPISNLREIRPLLAALMQTVMMKLLGPFCDCANCRKDKLFGAESFLWSLCSQRFCGTRRFLRAPLPDPFLSQINPSTSWCYFLEIQFNVIPRYPKFYLPFLFSSAPCDRLCAVWVQIEIVRNCSGNEASL